MGGLRGKVRKRKMEKMVIEETKWICSTDKDYVSAQIIKGIIQNTCSDKEGAEMFRRRRGITVGRPVEARIKVEVSFPAQ